MMKQITNFLFNSSAYKAVCVSAFMLVPSIVFCFFPQVISLILLLWGAVILLRDIKHRNFLKQTGSLLLLLFCLGYSVTLLLYAENDLVSTIHVFFWAIIEFFLLFAVDRERNTSPQVLLDEIHLINGTICVVGFVSGIASLVIFFMKMSIVMPDPEGLNAFWSMGIVNGRNSGIFNNAIPCANAMFVSVAAALFNLLHIRKKSVFKSTFYIVTIVTCYMVILTTLTRTFIYGIYIFVFIAVVAAGCQSIDIKGGGKAKRYISIVLAATICVVSFMGLSEVCKGLMEKAVAEVPINSIIVNADGFNKTSKVEETTEVVTETTIIATTDAVEEIAQSSNSEEELKQQISDKLGLSAEITLERNELSRLPTFLYPRDELWKAAMEVIPHSPIWGFTSGNRNATSLQYSTSEYVKTYWLNGIPTYHNAYFDIAVSAGLLGLCLMLAFIIIQIYRTLCTLFLTGIATVSKGKQWSFGILVAYLATHVFVTSMFFGVICFSNVSVCLYFWVVLGYVSKINDLCNGGKTYLSANKYVEKVLQWKKK